MDSYSSFCFRCNFWRDKPYIPQGQRYFNYGDYNKHSCSFNRHCSHSHRHGNVRFCLKNKQRPKGRGETARNNNKGLATNNTSGLLQYRNLDAAVLRHAFLGGIVGDGVFASASAANEFVGVDSALAKLGGYFFCALD